MDETEQIIGTVRSLRKDKTAVCLIVSADEGDYEEWFNLAEVVKPEYIRNGASFEAKVSTEKEEGSNRIIYFIKCANFKPKPTKSNLIFTESESVYTPASMYVSYAKDLFIALGNTEKPIEQMQHAIELVKQAHKAFE